MIPVYRVVEVALGSLLCFLPFLLLALYPFRHQLRFSLPATAGLVILDALVQILLNLQVSVVCQDPGCVILTGIVIHAVVYFTAVKDHPGKLLTLFLALANVAISVAVLSKGLERLLFGEPALEFFRWSFCVCMLVGHLTVTVPFFLYIVRQYAKTVHIQTSGWNCLWIIPATFCLIWPYHLYMTGQNGLQAVIDGSGWIFLMMPGQFFVYRAGFRQIMAEEKVRIQKQMLAMNNLQFNSLQSRINEARQARHDVRHHIHLIREYLRSGKMQELEDYLDDYAASLPDTQSMIYCQNYAVNTLLGYYVRQARGSNIDVDVFVLLPENLKLSETTLSVVLGNLLENAVEACREMAEGERRITVRGKADGGCVFFEVANTFNGNLRRSESGKILSTKSADRGLGLESADRLAQLHGGMLEVDAQNGIFRVSVLLPEQSEQA